MPLIIGAHGQQRCAAGSPVQEKRKSLLAQALVSGFGFRMRLGAAYLMVVQAGIGRASARYTVSMPLRMAQGKIWWCTGMV